MPKISAIILAGGEGRRMGNRDKGLVEVGGRKLIEHVIDRLRDQVADFIISCNRNLDVYETYGPVATDRQQGFPGPLVGVVSAATKAAQELCLIVPCDTPDLPDDLCLRLATGLDDHDIAVAHDGERLQHLVFLIRKPVIRTIDEYLADGNSSVKGWLSRLDVASIDFSDKPDAFRNVNSPA